MQLCRRSRHDSPGRIPALSHVSVMGFVTQGGDAGNLAKASVRSLSTQAAAEAQQLERGADGGPGAHLFSAKTQHSFLLIITAVSPITGDLTLSKELNTLTLVTLDCWAAGRL